MPQILIVEDEVAIADTLVFALHAEGFSTRWVRLAHDALGLLREQSFDLVILDVGLPDASGFEACKALRQFSEVPVMFLTARGGEVDRVVGLEIGADDYVVKPFSPREVAARVRAILKRSRGSGPSPAAPKPEFHIDADKAQIAFLGKPLRLTPHEFHLLRRLVSHPVRVWSREQLLETLGQSAVAGYERNIDTHIKSLRAKLREIAPSRDPIQTHRGFGYSYQPDKPAG
jgi:two-component system, OmpR family, catabolic regulation response regulator CreB